MKNLRKDAGLGMVLLGLYLVIKFIFRGGGLFLWLLGAVGLIITIVGMLPEDLHQKVMALKNSLLGKRK